MRPADGAATAPSSEATEVRSLPQRLVVSRAAPVLRGYSVVLLLLSCYSGGVRSRCWPGGWSSEVVLPR